MDADQMSSALKALADPTRLRIVSLLTRRDFCGCELVPLFGVSQPAVSQHLGRLKAAGLVHESRHGQWVFYHLDAAAMAELTQALDAVATISAPLIAQLGSGPEGCPTPALPAR